jgi:osmoprotectant transport system substrate-binding protein
VTLTDDRRSQNSDNVVPVLRSTVASAPLTTALRRVSEALSQDELLGLNRAVALDGTDPAQAARNFLERRRITVGLTGGSGTIVVAAADFSESRALAAVYVAVLDAAGYHARVRIFRDREVLQPALQSGQAQVTPEYAATLTTFLAAKAGRLDGGPSNEIDRTMAVLRPLAAARGLTVLDPARATDQNAFAVTKATAERLGVETLSDLAAKCPGGVTLGGTAECPQRPFCQPILEKSYGLKITGFTALDSDGPVTRRALQQGRVLVGEVFSSDADVVSAGG